MIKCSEKRFIIIILMITVLFSIYSSIKLKVLIDRYYQQQTTTTKQIHFESGNLINYDLIHNSKSNDYNSIGCLIFQ